MADLKDLAQTPTGVAEVCEAQSQAMEKTFTAIRDSIVRVNEATRKEAEAGRKEVKEEILSELDISDVKLAAITAVVDGIDGTEDGKFDAKQLVLDTAGKVKLNEAAIADIEKCCTDVKAALDAETKARVEQGSTLEKAVEDAKTYASGLIQGFEKTLNEAVTKISNLNNKMNEVIDGMTAIGACMIKTGETFAGMKAMFDDLSPATATNPTVV